jgi:hypothetical protein
MRPVTTVPRPVIVKTSSIGMRNGLSVVALGLRDVLVDRVHQLDDRLAPLGVALERLERRDATTGSVVARELVLGEQLADLELDELEELLVVDHVALFSATTMYGTPTWRASSTCSRVCGIGPSVAATTRIAPSIWAAPVIMFLM